MKLNLGSGETKLKDFINIDSEASANPDLLFNFAHEKFPYEDNSIEQINMIHSLEHITMDRWMHLFNEFHRVLVSGGLLLLAYPEFQRCALNFIENYKGMRDFWRKTLYGRQKYPGDFHVVPMDSAEIAHYLQCYGFVGIECVPEPNEEYNTFLRAYKGPVIFSREDLIRQELFHLTK